MQRRFERLARDRGKLQAGRFRRRPGGKIDDRVGESADLGHDRDRAIAHGAKLRQPARLEPRGNEDGVGAGLDQVRQILVIADDASDLSAVGLRRAR